MQLLILTSQGYILDESQIKSIELVNTDSSSTLDCSDFGLLPGDYNDNWFLSTLSFSVMLPDPSEIIVNSIKITLNSGDIIFLSQGNIAFEILDASCAQDNFKTRRFKLCHSNFERFMFSLENINDQTIILDSLDCGLNQYFGIDRIEQYKQYMDFSSESLVSHSPANLLEPSLERTYCFYMDYDKDYFTDIQNQFLVILPKLSYHTEDGPILETPVQPQATVIMPPLDIKYLDSIMDNFYTNTGSSVNCEDYPEGIW